VRGSAHGDGVALLHPAADCFELAGTVVEKRRDDLGQKRRVVTDAFPEGVDRRAVERRSQTATLCRETCDRYSPMGPTREQTGTHGHAMNLAVAGR
jgi:hypothetical protein